jgi:hypothetical protein
MQKNKPASVEKKSLVLKLTTATLFIMFMFAMITHSQAITQVSFQEESWNAQANLITRNGSTLPTFQPNVLPDYAEGLDFHYILDDQFDNSRSLTSSAVGNPQIYQHIYGFSELSSSAAYITRNQTGHSRTMLVTDNDVITLLGKSVTNVKVVNNIKLDGSLLLAKPVEDPAGFKNLLASFEVLVNKETLNNKGAVKTSKVFKGTVRLIGNKNGKVTIKTTGNIKKKYISEIITSNGLIQVNFDNVLIPYKTNVKVGQQYTLNTQVNSLISTTGFGTGSEVNFGPDVLSVPEYQEKGIVPEPLSVLLLLGGLTRVISRRRGAGLVNKASPVDRR